MPIVGTINQAFQPIAGMQVFAGLRAEPFFFDLGRFYAIFPDRDDAADRQAGQFPVHPGGQHAAAAGFPSRRGRRPISYAGLNCLCDRGRAAPRRLAPRAGRAGVIRLWETTSLSDGAPDFDYVQHDRLARPATNEALATVTDRPARASTTRTTRPTTPTRTRA